MARLGRSGNVVGTKLQVSLAHGARRAQVPIDVLGDGERGGSCECGGGAELLEKRKAIQQANAHASGFVISEVETTGHVDWHAAKVVGVCDVTVDVRCVTLETKVSHELVALESAYLKPGNVAQVRLNGKEVNVVPLSPPISINAKSNAPVLYKLRGDIPAGTVKMPQFSLSVKALVELHVDEATNPELYTVTEGQDLEVGPYVQESPSRS